MSTQQILGVVGGVVGAFFGYPQLGFVVGSLVGGLLTPGEKTEGPRLDDLKVQVSTYGAGIPIVYGTERVGGNVVWSTNKIETETTETQGKGGAPEHTSYRYFVHMGIVLCETPRDGSTVNISKIFEDGKLKWDARSGISIGSALASEENPFAFFVLYQGHADQLPDPIEELYEGGPGTVPAYRGVVRIRMNGIECPGGRIPQFSFELTTTPAVTIKAAAFETGEDSSGIAALDGVWSWFTDTSVPHTMHIKWNPPVGEPVPIAAIPLGSPYSALYTRPYAINEASDPQAMYSIAIDADTVSTYIVNLPDGAKRLLCNSPNLGYGSVGMGARPNAAQDASTGNYAVVGGSDSGNTTLNVITQVGTIFGCDASSLHFDSPIVYSNERIYAVISDAGLAKIAVVNATSGVDIGIAEGPAVVDMRLRSAAIRTYGSDLMVYVQGNSDNYGAVYQVSIQEAAGVVTGSIWTLKTDDAAPLGTVPSSPTSPAVILGGNVAVIGPTTQGDWRMVKYLTYDPQPVSVSEIIAELCERAEETRYDVSAIPETDTVWGYKLQNPASARSDIDPLLTAFAIYIVDEDGVIKFRKYEDITSEATISYDELGQAEHGAEPADAMPLNRAQEIDMPRSVTVNYIEPTFDYQTASEKEVRQVTQATEDMIVELPVATNSDHAKQVASMILFAKWRAQNTRSFKTSRKYAFLSPGDGVTVEYPRGNSRLWRITSMTDTGALCEFNVEPGDAELYTQTAIGATGYPSQEVAPLAPPTRMVIGDWAMLQDADNTAGPYVAMEGFSADGWNGAELFVGDDDTNLTSRGVVSNAAVIGVAESVLGSWVSGAVDETNLVTVSVGDDELSSITRTVLLAGTTNAFAIGAAGRWEIAQFQRADDLGGGRYILSGLRRGLRGTEYTTGTHEIGDTFVLLALAGMLKPSMEVGAIGQTRSYRAISKGRSFGSAASRSYAGTGEPLKPFSPVSVRKSVVSNDITLTWERRTRMSENALAGILPLGETTEAYEVEIYSSSAFTTVKRVIQAFSGRTAVYTSAQQITDFGSNQTTLYVRVYQISDQVGRGHALEATV